MEMILQGGDSSFSAHFLSIFLFLYPFFLKHFRVSGYTLCVVVVADTKLTGNRLIQGKINSFYVNGLVNINGNDQAFTSRHLRE